MAPQWLPVPGLEDRYEVSDQGHVRSLRRGNRFLGSDVCRGYKRVTIHCPVRGQHTRYVHTLVAEAFLGPRPEGMECNHLNCDKLDNRVENLQWVTRSENNRHMVNNKRRKGQVLTEGSARLMRCLGKLGRFKTKELAEMFNVRPHVVWGVTSGRKYAWL